MDLRKFVRKIIPLRASVFESFRNRLDLRLDEVDSKLAATLAKMDTLQSVIDIQDRINTLDERLSNIERSQSRLHDSLRSELAVVRNMSDSTDCVSSAIDEQRVSLADLRGEMRSLKAKWESRTFGYDFERTRLPEERASELRRWYKDKTGKDLDLDFPQTYNEKIQWMKINGPMLEMGKLADKYLVRDFVSSRIGAEYLVPLVGVWDDPDEIDFDKLPDRFVLKLTHGSGWNIVVKDKASLNCSEARSKLKRWLNTEFSYCYGFELHYLHSQPRIIGEQYLENAIQGGGCDLFDYKFWCFDGRVAYIQFLENRAQGLKMSFYDRDWNKQPFVYNYPQSEKDAPKPSNLSEMILLAEKLAEGIPHVRVDLYRLDDGSVRFGELTFTSMSGVCRWDPPEADMMLGDLFNLPTLSDIGR